MVSKTKNLVISTLSVLFLVAWQAPLSFADSTQASLSITGGSYDLNSTFSLSVYEDSGLNPVYIVESDLQYDPAQLQFVSLDTTMSNLKGAAPSNGGFNGSVKITVFNLPSSPVLGKTLIGTVSFKNLGASSSIVNVDKTTSHVLATSNKDIWDGLPGESTLTFSVPTPISPPSISPTPLPVSSAKPSPQPVRSSTQSPDSTLGTTVAKLPTATPTSPEVKFDTTRWMAFIAICSVLILMLLARLFNVHKKIRAKSPWVYIEKVIKRIF